ncbi:MAG: pyruvate:ferredoxin (flavodoxin) oxidoreductase [Polyangiaceae bacterium]|nr:pyruvate:ferredoxin (flavodoxin) oxidoreductase [Polyangiaceae bacterium]
MERLTMDGNDAVASVAYRLNEVIAIYPITPASSMGELSDAWAAAGRKNLLGGVPSVVEMQSEGGAAGTVHGALQAGALTTTFTSSQGLLLMLPNMFKIAGELTPVCIHVAARTIATHALSIFGDHSDVMACRSAGFAMLCSASVQEAHDFALVAQMASLESRIPFLHFFDGFRTSHELSTITTLSDDDLCALMPWSAVDAHRARALTPDRPVARGTTHNPDTYFQAREAVNSFYDACPEVVAQCFARLAERTGRRYASVEYFGHPEARDVIVVMGSASQVVREVVAGASARGERVGGLVVRLYRPFPSAEFLAALPATVQRIAVLDRTKEPGAPAEPLHLDCATVLAESGRGVDVIGGRYGLSSKEFTPESVQAVLAETGSARPKRRFTVGIVDDVTHLSLPVAEHVPRAEEDTWCAVLYGLGSDGTVSASKSSCQIVTSETHRSAQGYFVYDSKKAGAVTISHLRFGHRPIERPYLIRDADLVACHFAGLLDKIDVLAVARQGATFLLNTPVAPERVFGSLPLDVQEQILQKRLTLWSIDADQIARDSGLGRHISTIMQVCFFALSDLVADEQAQSAIRSSLAKSYGKRGEAVIRQNEQAIAAARAALVRVPVPDAITTGTAKRPPVPEHAPEFVRRVTAALMAGQGERLPVSAFPVDGTWPTDTARWEKRGLASEIPVWDAGICIQCNKCTFVCPHAAIRAKAYPESERARLPADFPQVKWRGTELGEHQYTLQVAPEDCTGCGLCVAVCPAKDKSNPRHKAIDMTLAEPLLAQERDRFERFLAIEPLSRASLPRDVKHVQLLEPLFEFSGACAGCGETPYIKLLTQLFGDRLYIANATGCSSIYGGNLPTSPYSTDRAGRGPTWANSLFEDNAEFGLGFRLAVDVHQERAALLLRELGAALPERLVTELLAATQDDEQGILQQRARVVELRALLAARPEPKAAALASVCDYLVKKSVWLVGGDGWAYDIGFGGLDHVLASRHDVNILVLDTEVYSNTGGQQSKATPVGAAAKFASAGKETGKKDLGLIAMSYGHAYVARVAFGAKDAQTVRAFVEAEAHPGPSLIVAYSHCIAHGYDLVHGCAQQKLAVDSGVWPLYRFDPRRAQDAQPPLALDSSGPKATVREYMRGEARFLMVERADPERFERLTRRAERQAKERVLLYQQLSELSVGPKR